MEPWEMALVDALRQPLVPDGLASRILERCHLEQRHVAAVGLHRETAMASKPSGAGHLAPGADFPSAGPADPLAASEARSSPSRHHRPATNRRWLSVLVASVALLLLAIGAGWLLWRRPLTPELLARIAIHQIQEIEKDGWESPSQNQQQPTEVMRHLAVALRPTGYRPSADVTAIGTGAIWKFETARGEPIYVFELQTNRPVHGVPQQLQPLHGRNSHSWSVAAMQHNGRILLVCSLLDLRALLQPSPIA
ncbi:MAG: hypothetical protein KatS3mg111_4038 [Pirellulaceae bacterium]|nr:MAG: hypothetical protein KatS3mg111_4038 [Pirellulaceae bacterium]